jgi:predicted Zn-dependent protease
MTTLHIINSVDQNKIQEFINLGISKFNFELKIEQDTKIQEQPQRKYKSLSNSLDKQIRNAKSVNTQKADKLKKAMENLNNLVSSTTKNLTLEEAKEQYFISKNNQI